MPHRAPRVPARDERRAARLDRRGVPQARQCGCLRPVGAFSCSPETRPAGHALPWDVSPAPGPVARHRHSHTVGMFVYALLGANHDRSPYTQTGERVRHLAVNGMRLVVEELRADVTKTRKDGTRGRLRSTTAARASPARQSLGCGNSWRRGDRRRAVRPGAGGDRRRAVRQPPRAARQPARSPQPVVLAQDMAAKALRKLAGPNLPAVGERSGAGRQARPRDLGRGRASSAPRAERGTPRPTSRPRRQPR